MNKKLPVILVVFIIAVFLIVAYLFFFQKPSFAPTDLAKTPQPATSNPSYQIEDETLKNALNLYATKKQAGIDLTNGPCLGYAADDWVVDIAHNPRQEIDDKPQNQCAEFRKGQAHHFIELDLDGNLIRAE